MPGAKKGGRRSALEMLTRSHLRLEGVLGELREALGQEDQDVIGESLAFLRGPTRRHFRDEELSIFPRLPQSELRSVLSRLRADHRDHERAFDELDRLCRTGSYRQANALAGELGAALRDHSALEEAELWPRIAALPEEELQAAHREMRARRKR